MSQTYAQETEVLAALVARVLAASGEFTSVRATPPDHDLPAGVCVVDSGGVTWWLEVTQ